MKWTLLLAGLLLLLTNGDTYERRLHRKTMFRQPPIQGGISNKTQQTQQTQQTEGEDSSDSLTVRHVRVPQVPLLGSSQGNLPGNQSRKAGPNRRVLPHRRGLQPRTPISQGATPQETGNKPDPGRTPSGPTRTLSGSASSLNILASFAGKNRILVISTPHQAEGYYRLMMTLLKSDVYCEMAERHMHQIVMFHQEGEAGGRVRRVSSQGQITEEPLDPSLVPRLMNFLKLEEGKFSMVLLRKNLQVEEKYPYPVRLEAMYEVMDQTPMRKMEKARQRGFVQRCKAAGVEGQVVDSQGVVITGSDGQGKRGMEPTQMAAVVTAPTTKQTTTTTKPTTTRRPTTMKAPTTTTTRATTTTPRATTTTTRATTTTTRATTTTTRATTTTTRATTTTTRRTTTTKPPTKKPATTTTTRKPTTTTTRKPTTTTTAKPTTTTTTTKPTTTTRRTTTAKSTTTIVLTSKAPTTIYPQTTHWDLDGHKEQYQDIADNKPGHEVGTTSTSEDTLGEAEEEPGSDLDHMDKRPTDSDAEAEPTPSRRGRVRNDNTEGRKKANKPTRKNKSEKKGTKVVKGGNPSFPARKSGKKGILYQEKHDGDGSSAKQPNAANPLTNFFGSFERRRRLLVITSPSEDNRMYTQQRDEYLENVCEMALRKVSIVIIFGSWTNGSMKIDHYQLEQDQALKGVPKEDLTNQPLIKALRKELGMTFNDYYMVLTDFDMKVKQEYEVPIAMKAVTDFIDTFPSRITEMEQQKKRGLTCNKEDKSRSLENFLSRFRWRRRIFVISSPDDEEWAYQQQLYSMSSQACNLGLRHMSVLKLVGKDAEYTGGVLELYPINGSATVEREDLSASLVRDIRNYFQVSPEYFSMLLVGKDGNVKSWYPSPMWSMSIIYDLVDSMQLRRQEMAIQQSLGMRCPDDDGRGYHEQDPDGYHHRGYGY